MNRRRRILASLCVLSLLSPAGCGVLSKPAPGDDVLLGDSAYGWVTSQDVGYRFSSGLTTVPIGKGPLSIEKVEPVVEGDALRLLGVKARVLSVDVHEGPFDRLAGWPPKATKPDQEMHFVGLVEPDELRVAVPTVESDGRRPNLHIVVGYEVVGEGRGVQRGIWVTYRYQNDSRRVFLGSYLAVCAPKTAECQQEDEDGPVPE